MDRSVGMTETLLLHIISVLALVVIMAVLLLSGSSLGASDVKIDSSKNTLQKFRDETVEVGCQKEESYTTSEPVNFGSPIERVYMEEGFYKADLAVDGGETVKVEVGVCEEVKICGSGSGPGCDPGGEIPGGIGEVLIHYGEGDSEAVIEPQED